MFEFVQANWTEIVGAFIAGVAFASAVVKLTPSKRDDEILAGIVDKLSLLGLKVSPATEKADEKPKA